jgi:predicted TIM-barrel fold metal-dependent hydrolase
VTDPGADGWDCHVHVFDASHPVQPGHYQALDRPRVQIEAAARALGCGHLVLVQPSVYGSDNTLMLDALARQPGRHRGVVVLAHTLEGAALEAELNTMHALGVRGVRFNLVSPAGDVLPSPTRWAALAPSLRARGWHVQWYARRSDLPAIAALHEGSGLVAVLDHLAGFTPGLPDNHPDWQAVQRLAGQGAWLKLSGWYRLDASAPYAGLVPPAQRLARLFGQRMVWGSDWPHTLFAPDAMPAYPSTWQPVVDALGQAAALQLQRRVPDIYR